jgi:hypothetical protein
LNKGFCHKKCRLKNQYVAAELETIVRSCNIRNSPLFTRRRQQERPIGHKKFMEKCIISNARSKIGIYI